MTVAILVLGTTIHTAQAETVAAPGGWTETETAGGRTVTNGDATVTIGPWQDLGAATLDDWLDRQAGTPPDGATLESSSGVKPESRTGGYSVTRTVFFGQSKGMSILYACPGQPGLGRLLQLDSKNGKLGDIWKGGMFVEKVCLKDPKAAADPAQLVAREQEATVDAPSDLPSASLSPSDPPKGLKEIRGVVVMGIQPGGMFGVTDDFIALFDDGTYTSDLENTFGEDSATSKRKRPGYWGRWRMRGGELELKEDDEPGFEDTRGNWVARPGASPQTLSGCYGRLSTSSGADYASGTTVGVARTWCFWPNGRFTNSSTAFGNSTTGGGIHMRSTSPKARGDYVIKGYTAHFVYDDGHEVRAAFCFANEKKNHITLNGKRFMGN